MSGQLVSFRVSQLVGQGFGEGLNSTLRNIVSWISRRSGDPCFEPVLITRPGLPFRSFVAQRPECHRRFHPSSLPGYGANFLIIQQRTTWLNTCVIHQDISPAKSFGNQCFQFDQCLPVRNVCRTAITSGAPSWRSCSAAGLNKVSDINNHQTQTHSG